MIYQDLFPLRGLFYNLYQADTMTIDLPSLLYWKILKTADCCLLNGLLRQLHVEVDNALLEAYGCTDIKLVHDFYEVDYLPENDRTRFTIHPDARNEVLKRLLELNHKIHGEEVRAEAGKPKTGKAASKKGKKEAAEDQIALL